MVNDELATLGSLKLPFRPSLKAKKRSDSPKWEKILSRTVVPAVGRIAAAGGNERPRIPEFPVVLRKSPFVSLASAGGRHEHQSERVGLNDYSTECLRDYLDGTKSDSFRGYGALHGTKKVNQPEKYTRRMKSGGCRRGVHRDTLTVRVCATRGDNPLNKGIVSEYLRVTRNETTKSDEPVSKVTQKA
jgi:hypothetical protein